MLNISLAMPRYFFDLVSRQRVILDPDGVAITGDCALSGSRIMEDILGRMIEQIVAEEPKLRRMGQDWWIEVIDEEGRRLATCPVRLG